MDIAENNAADLCVTPNPPIADGGDSVSRSTERTTLPTDMDVAEIIKDHVFKALENHFYMEGPGRRPDLPKGMTVTNKLLLQLFLMKEDKQSSYAVLKTRLEKVVRNTAHVSEARITHRINVLIQMKASMPRDEFLLFLDQGYDFNELPEPLKNLGLNRLHLTGDMQFNGISYPNITNHVVIALQNFRSQIRAPSTFINKWLQILCFRCIDMTPKQLKCKVEKVVKESKRIGKKGDVLGLTVFHGALFLIDDEVPSSSIENCQTCPILNDIVKEKDHEIQVLEKQCQVLKEKDHEIQVLEKQCQVSNNQVVDLQYTADVLQQELQSTLYSEDKQKTLETDNKKLISETKMLQSEIKSLSDKSRTYKNNTLLRKENVSLQAKVNCLENEVTNLKSKSSHANLLDLKRKVESEQAQKSKWKTKYQKLNDSLVVVDNEGSLSDSDDEPLVNLRENTNNKFNNKVRMTYMALQGEADVPASKCSKVVSIVSENLHGQKLKGLPCVSSVLNMADEGHHVAKQHICDKILSSNHFTLSTDGTSRQKQHYLERHIVLDDGTMLSLGFSEVASDDAKSILEQTIEILEEITNIYCSTQTSTSPTSHLDKINETLIEILKKLKTLMSDRAANMKLFDKLFHEYKQEILGPDDASTIFLFCNAHFLLGLSASVEKVLRVIENSISVQGQSFGGPPLFFNEQATIALIRCAADVLGPRGDEKNGCRQEWLRYCEKNGVASSFSSFRSNRFNNIFDNASALVIHRPHILEFLKHKLNQKLKSIHEALQNEQILATILAVALLNKILTGPYWSLMRSDTSYSSFSKYVNSMNVAFEHWSVLSDPEEMVVLEPVFEDFHTSSFDIDFSSMLMSGCFCKTTFKNTFLAIVCDMRDVMKRQLNEFLEGGIFAGDLPHDVKDILDKCPLTNLTGEGLFGDFDYDINKRRHCSTHHRSTINMWKHNQTSAWLKKKSGKERESILSAAKKGAKSLRAEHREAVRREKAKVLERMEENERKKDEKEMSDLLQKNKVLDSVLKNGLCVTEEDLLFLFRSGTAEDLKNQIRYRKMFLNARDLRLAGTKAELYQTLSRCLTL